jgi:hypothetical protein
MEKLSFWYKLAFITNCCWLLTLLLRYYNIIPGRELQSTVIVTGILLAPLINIGANAAAFRLWWQKKLEGLVPRWLLLTNLFFLLAQLYIYIK